MEEIKIRLWDAENKIMIYESANEYSKEPYNHYVIAWLDESLRLLYYKKPNANSFIVVNSKLMLDTGIKDKNGKKIYSDDIVKFNNDKFKSVVSFEDNSWCVEVKVAGVDYEHFNMYNWDDYEVIGNIYENPELIKE